MEVLKMGRKRALPYFILVVAILAIALLLIFKDSFFSGNTAIGDVTRLEVDEELVPISNDSTLFSYNGIMIEGENYNLRARNMEGTVLWTLKLKENISDIIRCGSGIVVNMGNKGIVTVSKAGEVLWQYEMTVPAYNILCSDEGLILIQYKEDTYNLFEIFNIKGVKYCSAIINSAHVISFDGIAGKYYTVSLLDVSSDKVLTKIATYNNKSEILWANNFENIIIPIIKYSEKGELIAVFENSIKKFKADGKMFKDFNFSNSITKLSMGKNFIVSIVKNTGFYDVFIHDYNLKQIGTAAVKTKPMGVFVGDTHFLLYDKDSLTVSNRQSKVAAIYESNIDINSTYIGDDSRVYIISNRKLQKLSVYKR